MDGTSECVGTDASFEVAQSGTYLFADFYDGEIYEADPSRAVYAWKKAENTQLKETNYSGSLWRACFGT